MSERQSTSGRRGFGIPFTKEEMDEILNALRDGIPLGEVAKRYGRDKRTIDLKVDMMREGPKPPKTRRCIGHVPHGRDGYRERCTQMVTSPGGVLWMCHDCRNR